MQIERLGQVGPDDSLDGRAFYAAKTASDGHQRYLFGWNPTRRDGKDYANWNWGGNLVVHQLVQQPEGTLSVRPPDTVDGAFARVSPVQFRAGVGAASIDGNSVRLDANGRFACAAVGTLPKRAKIEATVDFEPGTHGCGIVLRSSDDFESGYYVRLEPDWNRMVYDMYPRRGDVPFKAELERPVPLVAGTRGVESVRGRHSRGGVHPGQGGDEHPHGYRKRQQ